jgi:hypothetical protein
MKQPLFSFLLSITSFVSFSQNRDTTILIKSEPTKIAFASKSNISTASLTFLKFIDGEYGIQFNMVATSKTSAYIYAHNMDSLVFKLANNTNIILRPFKDTVYNQMDGTNNWTAYYFVGKSEISLLKSDRITQIFSGAGLQLKKQTSSNIYAIANSFL